MFSECHSPEESRLEAARQRRLAVFTKDTVVAGTLRAAADELDQQADRLEGKTPPSPQPAAA
jgi:hypothetical protein